MHPDSHACHGPVPPKRKGLHRSLFLGLFLLAEPEEAFAQSAPPAKLKSQAEGSDTISYPIGFFNDIRPSSALDIVNRVPGFTYDEGDTEVRGFAGAGGNVVIDGVAPSTKSIRLSEILSRISPGSIERIDLIRGGAPGIEMQGKSVIVNVVRKGAPAPTGAVRGEAVFFDGEAGSSLTAEMSRRMGWFSFDGNLELSREKDTDSGISLVTRRWFSDGLAESGYGAANDHEYRYKGAVTLAAKSAPQTVTVNLGTEFAQDDDRDAVTRSTASGVASSEFSKTVEKHDKFEASIDYETVANGIKLHALTLKNHYRVRLGSTFTKLGNVSSSTTIAPVGETIARATMTGQALPWLTLESGAEGALNFLDQTQTQLVNDVRQVIPNANVRVDEQRGEMFGTAGIAFAPGIRGEFGTRYEGSVIRQAGDTNREKWFSFVKPRAVLTIDATDRTQLRLRFEREVGQLNFEFFAASSDFIDGTVTAGNADLEPERAWVTEMTFEQRFWTKGSFVASYAHAEVEAVNDRIPVFNGLSVFDAPGNIGRGTRDVATANLSIPMDAFGIANGQLRADVTWRWSQVSDPFTGLRRRISDETPISLEFSYIQDFPLLDSTVTWHGQWETPRTSYRLRELRREGKDFQLDVSLDWKIAPDLLFNMSAENFLQQEKRRQRTLFGLSRADAFSSGSETLFTYYRPLLKLGLRHNF